MNFVLLYLKDNPEAEIEEAIACTREILDKKKKDLLKHVLIDGFSDLPKPSKHLHLSCMKVFQMFFNSSNGYDSNTEMLEDIKKAIYIPLEVGTSKPLEPLEVGTSKPPLKPLEIGTSKPLYSGAKKKYQTINYQFNPPFKISNGRFFGAGALRNLGHGKTFILPKVRFSFA